MGFNGNDCGCLWIILLIILLVCCCGGQSSGGGCGCQQMPRGGYAGTGECCC